METTIVYWGYIGYMGSCQNYGPFLGTLNITGRIIIGTQKGTTILTTTHIGIIENNMETAIIYWGSTYRGYIGMTENKMEATIQMSCHCDGE